MRRRFEKVRRAKLVVEDGETKVLFTEYRRQKKPPTLKQYAIRKHFAELSSATNGVKGVSVVDGRPIPSNAVIMSEGLGAKAKDLITAKLKREYNKKFGAKV